MNLVIRGLARNPAKESNPCPVMAGLERHGIPASADMTIVLFVRRTNSQSFSDSAVIRPIEPAIELPATL